MGKINKVGDVKLNHKGETMILIEKIVGGKRYKVRFENGFEKECTIKDYCYGTVKNTSHYITEGQVFKNKLGDSFIVTNVDNQQNIKIKFIDEHEYCMTVTSKEIRKGSPKNVCSPSICNVGFIGFGKHNSVENGKVRKSYQVWLSMIKRCYDETQPQYKNVTVCNEWHNYQNFANWFDETYPKNLNLPKLELDKDLLQQGVENKVYSPETCIWLPHNVNSFLANTLRGNTSGHVGVYVTKYKNTTLLYDFLMKINVKLKILKP